MDWDLGVQDCGKNGIEIKLSNGIGVRVPKTMTSKQKKKRKHRKNKSHNAIASGHPVGRDFGNRLYENGIKKIEDVERRYKESQLMKEMNEYKDLTFIPKINQISRYYGPPENLKPEDNLINTL